ncbi:MAG: 2-hydroxyacid dehydrogenase [Chitinophagaceae bacterium]|jgi:D-lactate dehydrogenase
MKIAFFSTKTYDKQYFETYNKPMGFEIIFFEVALNSSTVNLTKGFDAICAFVNDKIDEQVVESLHSNGVKLIALRCAGFNNVNIQACVVKGIKVVRVPAYSPEAVAEHTVALILTLNRKTHKAYNRVREGNFSLENLTGFNLFGKTIGVIGTGKIGITFSKIMLGFGCKVVAYDIVKSDALEKLGVEYLSLDDLLSCSDIVSLHCPLTPQTLHLINKESFEKMKDGVMLINTSRGGLINTKDTITALKKGKIAYLGIDVYEQEQDLFFKDLSDQLILDDDISRLLTFPNVLVTAHQAFLTKEALTQIAQTTLNNISDVNKGIHSKNEIIIA